MISYFCVILTQLIIKSRRLMEKKDEKTRVYNVIIMDRSGSMWDIQKPAIMG